MQQLTPNQALNNLKQGLDIATKKGAFDNLETAATLLQSLTVIAQELQPKEGPEEKKK
jgi:hypothetical protein